MEATIWENWLSIISRQTGSGVTKVPKTLAPGTLASKYGRVSMNTKEVTDAEVLEYI